MEEQDLDNKIVSIYSDAKSINGKVTYIENQLEFMLRLAQSLYIRVSIVLLLQLVIIIILIVVYSVIRK